MKKYLLVFAVLCCTGIKAAQAQTNAKVIVDNNKVRVTQYISMPGKDVCGVGKHSHPAHLTVLLTAATVTITDAGGKVITQKAPAGTTFWSDAETHEVINSGKVPMKALIIETK